MRDTILILMLLLLSCQNDECSDDFNCFDMISISDAIPVQFWINGEASFNEKIEPGIERHCFNQLFNADDEIRIQFTDDEDLVYRLSILDQDEEEITTVMFDQVDAGVYQLEFTPEDLSPSVTEEKIKLIIEKLNLGDWTEQVSAADDWWISVTYGNGLFVAVSFSGTSGQRIMTSPDGITWTLRSTPANLQWTSVTFGNGLFVAVAASGTGNRVMTSPDGITWTSRTSAADNSWNDVTYGNGLFVAVASSGTGDRVMTSPDGITWTIRTSAADNAWGAVTYGNGLFVAVAASGSGNRVMTSPNGITWTIRTSAADNSWESVAYGIGLFVAVSHNGTNQVMTSPDGITWTSRTTPGDKDWREVVFGNGFFIAVGNNGTGQRSMYSVNGIDWAFIDTPVDNDWLSIAFGNDLFVATSDSGTGNRVISLDIEGTQAAYSDYLSIKVSHAKTKLLQISNETDYAGIIYDGISPTPHFNIRVKAKFFSEGGSEENEAEELSDGSVVKLLGTVKKQKLLEIEPAPFYMHLKLKYALQHNTIFIDNMAWVKEDNYEISEPQDEHDPFREGKTWLTQKNNSYITNPFS